MEAIDPVRFISNHSTGKMGYALASVCAMRGAKVTLVSGKTALAHPLFVDTVDVVSAKDMYEAVTERFAGQDIIIKAAAVADYRPKEVAQEKIKKKSHAAGPDENVLCMAFLRFRNVTDRPAYKRSRNRSAGAYRVVRSIL